MGCNIIAIDGGDEKREMTKKLGASQYVDFMSSKNVVSDVKAATEDGLGPHAVILVAVNEKPFQQAAEVSHPSPTGRVLVDNILVCSPTRNRCSYRSSRRRISASSSIRVGHQDDHDQGILRWKPP